MDKDQQRRVEDGLRDAFIPPERGEVTLAAHSNKRHLREKKGLRDKLATLLMVLGSRLFGLMSVVLLSAGINIWTALLDNPSPTLSRKITTACFMLSGTLFFVVSVYIERCYEIAREQQREQIDQKSRDQSKNVNSVLDLAADQLVKNKRWWITFLSFALSIVLLLTGLYELTFETSRKPAPPIQTIESTDPAKSEPPANVKWHLV